MHAAIERLTGIGLREQWPAWLVGLGHGGTHWILGTFYLLLPYIKQDLGLSYAAAGALVTVIHVSAFTANFASGAAVDVTGKRVLLQVMALMGGALALFLCGWAEGMWLLLPMVMVIGATNNLWHPAAISYLSRRYPRNRGYALSLHTLGASVGDAIAPLVIGTMLVAMTWQQTATIGALPIIVLAVLIGLALIGRDRDVATADASAGRVDRHGYVAGMKQLLKDRGVLGLATMAGFRSLTQSGLLVFIPMYLATVLKVGPFWTGFGLMAMQLGGLIAGPVAGAWSDRIGRRRIVLAGLTATTVVVFGLGLAANEVAFIAGVSILGFMLFAVRPVIHSWMMDITPDRLHGSATSVLFGTQSLFSMAAPIVGGMIADAYGVAAVFYALAGTMLIANVLVYTLPDAERLEEGAG